MDSWLLTVNAWRYLVPHLLESLKEYLGRSILKNFRALVILIEKNLAKETPPLNDFDISSIEELQKHLGTLRTK